MSVKTVIILGGSRGIGKACALVLAQQGYNIILTYANNRAEAEIVSANITQQGGHAAIAQCNISNADDVQQLFTETVAQHGEIYAVINTAGIAIMKSIAEFSIDEFNHLIQTNITGTFNVLQAAYHTVCSGGRMIMFSSNVTLTTPVTYGPYAASKAAVETLVQTFAKELRGKNITINTISPGPTATEMFFKGKSEQTIQIFANMSPLERLGQPEDIANVVKFLLSDDATWVNAQVIRVNGGFI